MREYSRAYVGNGYNRNGVRSDVQAACEVENRNLEIISAHLKKFEYRIISVERDDKHQGTFDFIITAGIGNTEKQFTFESKDEHGNFARRTGNTAICEVGLVDITCELDVNTEIGRNEIKNRILSNYTKNYRLSGISISKALYISHVHLMNGKIVVVVHEPEELKLLCEEKVAAVRLRRYENSQGQKNRSVLNLVKIQDFVESGTIIDSSILNNRYFNKVDGDKAYCASIDDVDFDNQERSLPKNMYMRGIYFDKNETCNS